MSTFLVRTVLVYALVACAPGTVSWAQDAAWISPSEHQRVILPKLSPPQAVSGGRGRESDVSNTDAVVDQLLVRPSVRKPGNRGAEHRGRLTPQMQAMLERASRHFEVDAHLVQAVIHAESAFNPRAVSPKNAIGLMQVLPSTARDLGLQDLQGLSVEQLLADPRVSIVLGTKYLAEQLARFNGNVELAVAAYNAGPGAVVKAGLRVPNYPETQQYVRRVLSLASSYRRVAEQGAPS